MRAGRGSVALSFLQSIPELAGAAGELQTFLAKQAAQHARTTQHSVQPGVAGSILALLKHRRIGVRFTARQSGLASPLGRGRGNCRHAHVADGIRTGKAREPASAAHEEPAGSKKRLRPSMLSDSAGAGVWGARIHPALWCQPYQHGRPFLATDADVDGPPAALYTPEELQQREAQEFLAVPRPRNSISPRLAQLLSFASTKTQGLPALEDEDFEVADLTPIPTLLRAPAAAHHGGLPTLLYSRRLRCMTSVWGHREPTYSITHDLSGRCLVTGSDDKTVKVWSAVTGSLLMTLRGHTAGHISDISISADNRLVAAGTDASNGIVRVWSLQTGAEVAVFQPHTGPIRYLAFDPVHPSLLFTISADGRAAVSDVGSRHCDSTGSSQVHQGDAVLSTLDELDGDEAGQGGGGVETPGTELLALAQSRAASAAAARQAGAWQHSLQSAIPAPPGQLSPTPGTPEALFPVSISLLQHEVGGGSVPARGVSCAPAPSSDLPRGTIMAVHPHGGLLATGCDDGCIRFWRVASSAPSEAHSQSRSVFEWAWDAARYVAVPEASVNPFLIACIAAHRGKLHTLAFSPDGRALVSGAAGDPHVQLWTGGKRGHFPASVTLDLGQGEGLIGPQEGSTRGGGPPTLVEAKFNCDSSCLLTSQVWVPPEGWAPTSHGGVPGDELLPEVPSVKVWHVPSGALLATLSGHVQEVNILAPSPVDPTALLTAGKDGRLQLWRIPTRGGTFLPTTKPLATWHLARLLEVPVDLAALHGGAPPALHTATSTSSVQRCEALDASWAPDGMSFAVSDDQARITHFGVGGAHHPPLVGPVAAAQPLRVDPDGCMRHPGQTGRQVRASSGPLTSMLQLAPFQQFLHREREPLQRVRGSHAVLLADTQTPPSAALAMQHVGNRHGEPHATLVAPLLLPLRRGGITAGTCVWGLALQPQHAARRLNPHLLPPPCSPDMVLQQASDIRTLSSLQQATLPKGEAACLRLLEHAVQRDATGVPLEAVVAAARPQAAKSAALSAHQRIWSCSGCKVLGFAPSVQLRRAAPSTVTATVLPPETAGVPGDAGRLGMEIRRSQLLGVPALLHGTLAAPLRQYRCPGSAGPAALMQGDQCTARRQGQADWEEVQKYAWEPGHVPGGEAEEDIVDAATRAALMAQATALGAGPSASTSRMSRPRRAAAEAASASIESLAEVLGAQQVPAATESPASSVASGRHLFRVVQGLKRWHRHHRRRFSRAPATASTRSQRNPRRQLSNPATHFHRQHSIAPVVAVGVDHATVMADATSGKPRDKELEDAARALRLNYGPYCEWLLRTRPSPSILVPQLGDELVYCPALHAAALGVDYEVSLGLGAAATSQPSRRSKRRREEAASGATTDEQEGQQMAVLPWQLWPAHWGMVGVRVDAVHVRKSFEVGVAEVTLELTLTLTHAPSVRELPSGLASPPASDTWVAPYCFEWDAEPVRDLPLSARQLRVRWGSSGGLAWVGSEADITPDSIPQHMRRSSGPEQDEGVEFLVLQSRASHALRSVPLWLSGLQQAGLLQSSAPRQRPESMDNRLAVVAPYFMSGSWDEQQSLGVHGGPDVVALVGPALPRAGTAAGVALDPAIPPANAPGHLMLLTPRTCVQLPGDLVMTCMHGEPSVVDFNTRELRNELAELWPVSRQSGGAANPAVPTFAVPALLRSKGGCCVSDAWASIEGLLNHVERVLPEESMQWQAGTEAQLAMQAEAERILTEDASPEEQVLGGGEEGLHCLSFEANCSAPQSPAICQLQSLSPIPKAGNFRLLMGTVSSVLVGPTSVAESVQVHAPARETTGVSPPLARKRPRQTEQGGAGVARSPEEAQVLDALQRIVARPAGSVQVHFGPTPEISGAVASEVTSECLAPWEFHSLWGAPSTGHTVLTADGEARPPASFDAAERYSGLQGQARSISAMDMGWDAVVEGAPGIPLACRLALLRAVLVLSRTDNAAPFTNDVDLKFFPDYLTVVPVPMCLHRIALRLLRNFYRSVAAFVFDAVLIFKNCAAYNPPGSEIVQASHGVAAALVVAAGQNPLQVPGLGRAAVKAVDDFALWPVGQDLSDKVEVEDGDEGWEDGESSDDSGGSLGAAALGPAEAARFQEAMLDILTAVGKEDQEGVFEDPVDVVEVPDYLDVVARPMCLSQVRHALLSGHFGTVQSFAADLMQVFDNALLYNEEDSPLALLAMFCKALATDQLHAAQATFRTPLVEELPPLPDIHELHSAVARVLKLPSAGQEPLASGRRSSAASPLGAVSEEADDVYQEEAAASSGSDGSGSSPASDEDVVVSSQRLRRGRRASRTEASHDLASSSRPARRSSRASRAQVNYADHGV